MTTLADLAARYPKLLATLEEYDYFPGQLQSDFARILDALEGVWGTPQAGTYLNGLLVSDRPGGRRGFPLGVLEGIMFLHELHGHHHAAPVTERTAVSPLETAAGGRQTPVPPKRNVLSAQRAAEVAAKEDTGRKKKSARARFAWPVIGKVDVLTAKIKELKSGNAPTAEGRRPLGEVLAMFKVIEPNIIDEALALQRDITPRPLLGKVLVNEFKVDEAHVVKALCVQQRVFLTDPVSIAASPEALKLIPIEEAREKGVAPLLVLDRAIVLAVPDPFKFAATDYFKFLTGKHIELVQADPERIATALAAASQSGDDPLARNKSALAAAAPEGAEGEAADGEDDGHGEGHEDVIDQSDSSVIGLVNRIINDAIRVGASDIHIEVFPRAKAGQVRFRRDGIMEPYSEIPMNYYPAVVSRIKIMASLDISERRRPQDGRISFAAGKKRVEFRLATLPTAAGLEAIVMRLLSGSGPLAVDKIGIAPHVLGDFKDHLSKPHGLVLVCGPTGSGKTTTLHSGLKFLNTPHRKIWTAEDPVEITQRNISQVQINHRIGLDFSSALRAFLRADPDVIMIGEMRDLETAKIAVESAMTGHLVLSTLHTNSAAETVTRVLDMGVDQFNFSDALRAVLAQRLTRRVCGDCAEPAEAGKDELVDMAHEFLFSGMSSPPTPRMVSERIEAWRGEYGDGGKLMLRRHRGCEHCMGTGYRGRIGIHELLTADTPEMRRLIRTRASADAIKERGIAGGMLTLRQDGILKVLQGITTMAEIHAVCS